MIILFDALQINSRRVRLTYGTRGEVHDIIPILRNIRVQLRHADMCPIASNHREHMAKRIRFGNGAINVRDYNQVRTLPEENPCCAGDGARCGERKGYSIRAFLEIELLQLVGGEAQRLDIMPLR